MNYAIIDGTTVKNTGTLQQLFPNTSFSAGEKITATSTTRDLEVGFTVRPVVSSGTVTNGYSGSGTANLNVYGPSANSVAGSAVLTNGGGTRKHVVAFGGTR